MHGPKIHPKAVHVADMNFRTSAGFNFGGAVIAIILTGLYWYWW
jgi:hypothetical protein